MRKLNLREFGGFPGEGTPKSKTWKVEIHNAVICCIYCNLSFNF